MENSNRINFTPREIDCINCLKQGKTAQDISLILGISKRTVESYTERLKEKLACSNMFQLGYTLSIIYEHEQKDI